MRERGGRGGKGQEKREAGLWCGFVQIGKMHGWRQKEGTGSGCGPAENRASGWGGRRAEAEGEKKSRKRRRVRGSVRGKKLTGKGIEKYTGSAGRSGKLRREGEMVEKVRMEWAVGRTSAWGEKILVEERAREREGEE